MQTQYESARLSNFNVGSQFCRDEDSQHGLESAEGVIYC